MAQIPTVKIKAGKDYALVNESDYDPATMELFDEPAPKAKAKAAPKAKPATATKPAKKAPARKAKKK